MEIKIETYVDEKEIVKKISLKVLADEIKARVFKSSSQDSLELYRKTKLYRATKNDKRYMTFNVDKGNN